MTLQIDENDPLDTFKFALKAEESKRQYPRRLKMFLDFGIDSNLQLRAQCQIFYDKAKNDVKWTTSYFMKFLEYQKDRAARGDILPTTIPNYYKAAKLFCVMNDIVLNWQKIARGVPYQNRDIRLYRDIQYTNFYK